MKDKKPNKTLSKDEIENLIKGNPRELLRKTRELDIDMTDLKFDVGNYLILDGLGISESSSQAVDFVFWVSYFVEKSANDLIIDPQIQIGAQEETMKALVEELSFGSKINVIKKLYMSKGGSLLKMMRKIQDLRNHVAHGRFDKLTYEGHELDKGYGQILIIGDIRDAYLEAEASSSTQVV